MDPDCIPEAWVRELHGIGHINPYNRPVVPGNWPHGVKDCRFEEHPVHWQDKDGNWLTIEQIIAGIEGKTLVCTGCGLDCT
jgi:hypothetical protein